VMRPAACIFSIRARASGGHLGSSLPRPKAIRGYRRRLRLVVKSVASLSRTFAPEPELPKNHGLRQLRHLAETQVPPT
jgi:hypothetical protein